MELNTSSTFMQRHPYNEKRNVDNVGKALDIIELFFVWSGLRINRGKTYLSIFGIYEPSWVRGYLEN